MSPNDPIPDPTRLLHQAQKSAPAPTDPEVLAALQTRFPELRLERRIGEGGMSTVYRAVQTKLQRPVALKVLREELAAQPEFRARFEREAQAMAALDHPRILRVLEFGERSGVYFLLTDLVDGVDLRKLMELGQVSPGEALRLVPQICEALRYAHMHGVVHRDVKPENILIDLEGNVRMADFGLARMARGDEPPAALTRTSQILGTPHYMAPEQWRSGHVDHRADIFSLGVVLYELLTGTLPIGDFAPPSDREGVPPRLDSVVRRALAQDPDRRFQQVDEFEQALDQGTTAVATEGGGWLSRRQGTILLVLAGGITLFGCSVLGLFVLLASGSLNNREAIPAYLLGATGVFTVSTAVAVFASHRLQHGPEVAGRGLAAFLSWFGPVAVFVVGLLGLLAQSEDVQERPWILLLVAGVLLPLAAWFLHRQATEAVRPPVGQASTPK
ncbi:MAG: bifunctional serine/threonine protein kinase/MFS transporter [Planctomycetota bacterium]